MKYSAHHVAISVTNRQISVDFYHKLGFKEVCFWEAANNSLTITHLQLNSFILELFCYKNYVSAPDSIRELATDLPTIGTKHVGFQVESIDAAHSELLSKGMIGEDVSITEGRTGPRYFFVKDPDGILVEILEDKRKF